ncbi:MAG: DUF2309 domain-containing protein [Candidatus Sericytochromatia bacterium]|nr:DUF2309 domain-containing protein [Candidatus Sericytochromatia bacterium]
MTTMARTMRVALAVDTACARIAPAWPLDRLIAVNPYWGFVDRPIQDAAAELGALNGTTLLMPRSYYLAQWQAGGFTKAHVVRALAASDLPLSATELMAALEHPTPQVTRRRLMTDVADEGRDLGHCPAWGEFVIRHISQACAAHFDEGQARWHPNRTSGLYGVWRELAGRDKGPRLLMGLGGFRAAVNALPHTPQALIAEAATRLALPAEARADYFTALLMSVNGWASLCAYRRWEARLGGGDDDQIVDLLAVRLAWELILAGGGDVPAGWARAQAAWPASVAAVKDAHRQDWVLQQALELAYQDQLVKALSAAPSPAPVDALPTVQAVFCIDVRSEVFRRALETVSPTIGTLGFAGFFGLPVAYVPPAGPPRPQLPGLLAPSLLVHDDGAAVAGQQAQQRRVLTFGAAVKDLSWTALSSLAFVEVAGLASLPGLLRNGFGRGRPAGDTVRPLPQPGVRPILGGQVGVGGVLDLAAKVALAAGILRAMSLTGGFARLVALIGHGAGTVNNPQAAGLHCGACGGQTGEINARALAHLLNDPAVRAGLTAEGLHLGPEVHVVAGLHNTTTDDIALFDLDTVPPSHGPDLEALRQSLAAAGRGARAERAQALGLPAGPAAAVDLAVRGRARDWSEVRPEWGLANNAAFIVAPRARTRGIDLGGRSFLHEYRWEQDADYAVLTTIMTAPMIVTHWINMQYHASTVDNQRYGSGNKLLHNVVGGRLGVLEGAGGDLRIGLAHQSVHNGRDWVHAPLRLSVFIEAPAAALDDVIARHPLVRDLVTHAWLHLFRIAPGDGGIFQRGRDGWQSVTIA